MSRLTTGRRRIQSEKDVKKGMAKADFNICLFSRTRKPVRFSFCLAESIKKHRKLCKFFKQKMAVKLHLLFAFY